MLLKVIFQKVSHFGVQVHGCVTAADSMGAVGVNGHVELNPFLHEFFGKFVRVLGVYIVIGRAMNN
jgi:hypothetical protein